LASNASSKIHSLLLRENRMSASKFFFVAAASALVGFSGAAHAADQASASVGASADVITPLTVTKNDDLVFGKFVVNGATAGTVVVAAADGARSKTGGVDLITSTGVQAGEVTVAGQTGIAYTVSLPTSVNLTSGENTMALGSFTTDQADLTVLTGDNDVKIGGTLTVAAGQAPGAYTGSFTVSANYN